MNPEPGVVQSGQGPLLNPAPFEEGLRNKKNSESDFQSGLEDSVVADYWITSRCRTVPSLLNTAPFGGLRKIVALVRTKIPSI